MDLVLDVQQVHQGLMDDRVRPVAPVAEQPAECVFHRPGRRCKYVRLHGWQLDDVRSREDLGDVEAVFVYVVEHQHLRRGFVWNPFHWRDIEHHVFETESVFDHPVFVLFTSLIGIHHHSAIVGGSQLVEAVGLQFFRYSVDLPGCRRTGGVVVLPGNIHF